MPYDSYPTATDLQTYVTDSGLTAPTNFDFQSKVDSAVKEWEERTGWFPFLAQKGDETFKLDQTDRGWGWGTGWGYFGGGFGTWRAGTRILDLECGVLSITSMSINGVYLKEGCDYRLLPLNARRQGWPFTCIDFMGYSFAWSIAGASEVTIVARCGFCTELPADAWQAILRRAFAEAVPQLSMNISGGLLERRRGDEQQRFGGPGNASPLAKERADALQDFEVKVMRYWRAAL